MITALEKLWRQIRYALAMYLVGQAIDLVKRDARLETITAFKSVAEVLQKEP